jgi:hypothetical protein
MIEAEQKIQYRWVQNYCIDRFDLEGPMRRLQGWVVGTPDRFVKTTRFLGSFNYTISWKTEPKANWSWRIFWPSKESRSETETDGLEYKTMNAAKKALQDLFSIPEDDVKTILNPDNKTQYE